HPVAVSGAVRVVEVEGLELDRAVGALHGIDVFRRLELQGLPRGDEEAVELAVASAAGIALPARHEPLGERLQLHEARRAAVVRSVAAVRLQLGEDRTP